MRRGAMSSLVAAACAALAVLPIAVPAASSPVHAAPGGWVVSLGDSYISGEAGRWAGNSNSSSGSVDAGGPTTYFDNPTHSAETIPGCHRSMSAEISIGGGISAVNFACSGARTSTFTASDGSFKPGIDFSNAGGNKGQALLLQEFAASHPVSMVQLSIGGNNFNFADIVQTCVTDWLLSPSWWPNYCNDDSSVASNFTAANVAAQTNAVVTAIDNVKAAMTNAGYAVGTYKIVVQTYPSPLPNGSAIRYPQSGFSRQFTGGCGFWNKDADWANSTALAKINGAVKNAAAATGSLVMDVASAFNGRRLCENTVNLLENTGRSSWTAAGSSDATEWIDQIRTVSTLIGPYQIQESIHPNYWGQLALRNCVRQAYNGASPRGGVCTHGTGLDAQGEPNMILT